jgi:uncharacterized membrane protein YidH (DUF202 family)/8-oxo-dGTP pyrophosphatase MutT (NUDIX family)
MSHEDTRTSLRGFVVARHPRHGVLLLQADKAKKGGLHYQLPGGHVDRAELETFGAARAAKVAAARELFEETGIDVRARLGRLERLDAEVADGGKRSFFLMDLSDADGVGGTARALLLTPRHSPVIAFTLTISHEHTGFAFEPSLEKAADMVQKHSGGYCSAALLRLKSAREKGGPRPVGRVKRRGRASQSMFVARHSPSLAAAAAAANNNNNNNNRPRRRFQLSFGALSSSASKVADDHRSSGGARYIPPHLPSSAVVRPRRSSRSVLLTPAEEQALLALDTEDQEARAKFRSNAVSSDCCGMRCRCFGARDSAAAAAAAAQVDPKTYFANERTFLNWMHTSVTLGSFGMLMFSVAKKQDFADAAGEVEWIGFAMVMISLSVILFAITSFYKRSELVRRRAEGPYEMGAGVVASALAITVIFGALVWMWCHNAYVLADSSTTINNATLHLNV